MEPLVKWNGGLERRVELVKSLMPEQFECYYEPFLGSGAVYFQMEGRTCFVSDKCRELMRIYKYVRMESPAFATQFKMMCSAWKRMDALFLGIADDLVDVAVRSRHGCYRDFIHFVRSVNEIVDRIGYSDVFSHTIPNPADFKMEKRHQVIQEMIRMEKLPELSEDEIEENLFTAMKASIFSFLSEVLNNKRVDAEIRTAALAFVLNYAADGPFRKDDCSQYRLPFGGKAVARRMLTAQVRMLGSDALKNHFERTTFNAMDGLAFLKKQDPGVDDFVLLDPPDEVKSNPGALDYSPEEHRALARYLLEDCDAKWMMLVAPNVSTMHIYHKAPVQILKVDGMSKLIIKNY